jgi:hypothetical protein
MRNFMSTGREIPGLGVTLQPNAVILFLINAIIQGAGMTLGFAAVRAAGLV